MKKLTNKLFNRAKRTSLESDIIAEKDALFHYNYKLNELQGNFRLTNAFANNSYAKLGTIRTDDGSFTQTKAQSIVLLLRNHFTRFIFDEPKSEYAGNTYFIPQPAEDDSFTDLISPAKVKWEIDSFMPYKIAGRDNILHTNRFEQ